MRLTKRKLRRILRESIRSVLSEGSFDDIERKMQPGPSHATKGNCPSFYDWEKLYSLTKSMRVSGRGEPTTAFLKAWNRYATNKGRNKINVPAMLYDETPECAYALIDAARRGGYEMSEEAYQAVCDAWMQDADSYSDFSWNYDPDEY